MSRVTLANDFGDPQIGITHRLPRASDEPKWVWHHSHATDVQRKSVSADAACRNLSSWPRSRSSTFRRNHQGHGGNSDRSLGSGRGYSPNGKPVLGPRHTWDYPNPLRRDHLRPVCRNRGFAWARGNSSMSSREPFFAGRDRSLMKGFIALVHVATFAQ